MSVVAELYEHQDPPAGTYGKPLAWHVPGQPVAWEIEMDYGGLIGQAIDIAEHGAPLHDHWKPVDAPGGRMPQPWERRCSFTILEDGRQQLTVDRHDADNRGRMPYSFFHEFLSGK